MLLIFKVFLIFSKNSKSIQVNLIFKNYFISRQKTDVWTYQHLQLFHQRYIKIFQDLIKCNFSKQFVVYLFIMVGVLKRNKTQFQILINSINFLLKQLY